MTRPDDHRLDDQLSELLHDAVADVEPSERLGELRARTSNSSSSRRWWVGAGAAALATAAVVTAIAVVGTDPPAAVDPPVADPPSEPRAVAAYFVGDTPRGPRLYREFQQVVDPAPGMAGLALLESGPDDPDYSSLWPAGAFENVSDPEDGIVEVTLEAGSAEPTELALQQVVYTLRAGFQEPQLAVQFRVGDDVTDPVAAAPPLDVLSHVNLSDPFEGQVVGGDALRVKGVANSFEATVLWTIESEDGSSGNGGFFTALGYMEERLFPFSGEIDVSSLDPGTYTLIVETSDPSGGAEGFGPFSDTRTVVIE